jgi:cysteinyl-tRNA synthetase
MSKSLGNSFFVKDALKHYPGEVLRFYLMSTHYRAPLNFSEEDLLASKKRLDKLYRLKKRVYGVTKKQQDKEFEQKMLEAMSDDLNISKALSYVDEFIKEANESLDKNPKDKVLKQKIISNIEFIDKLLGIGGSDAYEYFQAGIDEETKKKINALIQKRSEAKKEKNFELADKIRDELKEMGIQIQDTPNGTVWEKV